jgi:hypothetical protein
MFSSFYTNFKIKFSIVTFCLLFSVSKIGAQDCLYFKTANAFMIGASAYPSGTMFKLCSDAIFIGVDVYDANVQFINKKSSSWNFSTEWMGDAVLLMNFESNSGILRMKYDITQRANISFYTLNAKEVKKYEEELFEEEVNAIRKTEEELNAVRKAEEELKAALLRIDAFLVAQQPDSAAKLYSSYFPGRLQERNVATRGVNIREALELKYAAETVLTSEQENILLKELSAEIKKMYPRGFSINSSSLEKCAQFDVSVSKGNFTIQNFCLDQFGGVFSGKTSINLEKNIYGFIVPIKGKTTLNLKSRYAEVVDHVSSKVYISKKSAKQYDYSPQFYLKYTETGVILDFVDYKVSNQYNLLPIFINKDNVFYNKELSNDSCNVTSTVINYNFISITNGTESQEVGSIIDSKSERTIQTSYSKSSKAKEIIKRMNRHSLILYPLFIGIIGLPLTLFGVLIF